MNLALISSLVVAICWLSTVNGECCTTVRNIIFSIDGASCGSVGAQGRPDRCEITICNSGYAITGSYCGNGPCDIFGCKCENGCLRGDFTSSFLENYKQYIIEILEENSVSAAGLVSQRFWELFKH